MKNITTVLACALLCAYGAFVGTTKPIKHNTITASENNSLASVLHPITIHDTDTIIRRDTVKERVIVKVKPKYRKSKRTSYDEFNRVSAPIKLDSVREARKGTPPDTLPARKRYEIHGFFEPISEIR